MMEEIGEGNSKKIKKTIFEDLWKRLNSSLGIFIDLSKMYDSKTTICGTLVGVAKKIQKAREDFYQIAHY